MHETYEKVALMLQAFCYPYLNEEVDVKQPYKFEVSLD